MWSTNLSEGLLEICNSFEASEGEHKIWALQFCFAVKVRNATLGVKDSQRVNKREQSGQIADCYEYI